MYSIKLHRWLFSLTLLISLTSFSEIVHEQVKPVNRITEVVTVNNTTTSAQHISFTTQIITQESSTDFSFNFKAFIQIQNNLFFQKEKAQNAIVLTLKDALNKSHLKLVAISNTNDCPFSFIG